MKLPGVRRSWSYQYPLSSKFLGATSPYKGGLPLAKERELAIFTAVYDSVDSAKADLGSIETLYKDDFLGTFDAAVTRATKIVKQTVDATTDEIAEEMKEAAKS